MDDGVAFPADASAVDASGGRLVRMPGGATIGDKLNRGMEEARGAWCQKMDDDDWYGPNFLEQMMAAVLAKRDEFCRRVIAFLSPFLFFDVANWQVRRSRAGNLPGATLLFARDDWEHRPFRPLMNDEDLWFLLDQTRDGASLVIARALESFLAVRHRGTASDRGHTWVVQHDGRTLERFLEEERPLHRTPEELLPDWALQFYRELRVEMAL